MWSAWLVTGAVGCACYVYLDTADRVLTWAIYVIFTVTCVGVILAGVRHNRPSARRGWLMLAAGPALWLLGDFVYGAISLSPWSRYAPYASVVTLSAYPILAGGLHLITRGPRRRDMPALIDAAIVATALGLVDWVYLIGPVTQDDALPTIVHFYQISCVVGDMLLLAVTARLLTRNGRRTPSVRLLIGGTAVSLITDVNYTHAFASGEPTHPTLTVGFLVAFTCWAAAALHPSAAEPARPPGGDRFGTGRLVVLAVAVMFAPGVLFAEAILGHGARFWPAIGTAAVTVFLLMLLRMSGFVRQVQSQAHQLEDMAMRDALTGLANRRLFEERVQHALETGTPQVALLDLTGFKPINDQFGHAAGDMLLAAVAQRLSAGVRPGDLVARLGGDEFAVLMPDVTADEAETILERLAASLRTPVVAGDLELVVGAGFGVADANGISSQEELLRRADVAMYAAKADGERPIRRYTPDMDALSGEQSRIGAELRSALDSGQFMLLYQPIVELPDARTVAAEALVRWVHPVRGMIGPAEFIPAAERNGLIVELGAWILRTACAQAVSWQHAGGPERICVNVSARQLVEPGFASLVRAVLTETGLPADRLTIEVKETAVFGRGRALRALEETKSLGVRTALDDFGTGHSSLGLLQTVAVDAIKVDKTLVDNITMAGRHTVIATGLIQLADGLGLATVAEGVETAEQAAELYRIGYRLAQGYHFGRPAPALAFTVDMHQPTG